jgi:pyruvate/2-oxoglutarate dehydrogenase complex dihydrolipoamide acyltransferase (E2) component
MRTNIRIPDPGEAEPIVELATDKANQEVQAPAAGKVIEILVAEGDILNPDPDRVLVVLEADS